MNASMKAFACRVCFVSALVFGATIGICAQNETQNSILSPPPNSKLSPVHLPDITKLEPDVREHLLLSERALSTAINNPQTTPSQLAEGYGILGQIFQAYSVSAPARECYLNASELAPKDFRWIYLLGKLDQEADRTDDAIRRFKLVRTLRPDYLGAPINLGNLYLQLNRLPDAKQSFSEALTIEAKNAAANYGLGQVALSERRYAEAVTYFEQALEQLPGANRIHYSLAMAYRGLGNNEKAKTHLALQGTVGVRVADPLIDNLQQLIAGERIHLIRGKLALESKRYAEAITEFEQALKANPKSLEAHINYGAALTQTGDLRGAAAQFQEAARIDPKSINAHYNLAVLLADEQKYEEAITHLQAVLAINENDLRARYLLAQQLVKANRLPDALAEFARVVAANPDHEGAVLDHAKLLLRLGDYRLARESLEKAYTRNADRTETAALLAYLLAAVPQLDLRDGARALDIAQRIYQTTGSTYHGAIVAMSLAELGRCDEAAALVKTLLQKAAKNDKPDLLERLRKDLIRYEQERPCRPAA